MLVSISQRMGRPPPQKVVQPHSESCRAGATLLLPQRLDQGPSKWSVSPGCGNERTHGIPAGGAQDSASLIKFPVGARGESITFIFTASYSARIRSDLQRPLPCGLLCTGVSLAARRSRGLAHLWQLWLLHGVQMCVPVVRTPGSCSSPFWGQGIMSGFFFM